MFPRILKSGSRPFALIHSAPKVPALRATFPLVGARFNSSSSSAPIDEISTKLQSFPEAANTFTDTVTTLTHDQLGYLNSVGMAQSWWWPPDVLERTLEYVHVYSGLPWWGTIVATTIAIRVVMFPLFVKSSDTMARSAKAKPEMDECMKVIRDAQTVGERQKAALMRKQITAKYGIKYRYMMAPFLQFPIAIGFFTALRHMALLPVDGFPTQGAYWFPDLSAADPYLGLQLISAATFMTSMKLGGETGASNFSPGTQKLLTYVLPTLSIPFTMNLSSGVVLYFATNAACSFVQSALLRNKVFRKIAGLQEIVPRVKKPGEEAEGMFDGIKKFAQETKKSAESKAAQAAALEEALKVRKARSKTGEVIIRKRKSKKS
ncbi:Mitochondrial inner membrane protein insertion mediating protein [Komagataella phaffii CBS 7435]|uniref:Mitochondrial inner membrane insertase n=2 Tax=Komagataella phaffii TaxID=460519 RepID=C4QYW0_KOMPG|nr:Mitochondrial inner membrane insertase [Komagataella phaffii GS115]AOA61316.1 GQ67_01565T0 [Komagataella phaffii]CAH2447261.1 Mitochondrial inner membrane protein insertion mediating protein [Komagataella phaffii CBS 7435]AOA66513.1 GQ68_01581T0 [Komagataella phaffii GS115]CAY68434.1 Mitochondrial inner membrane insertase [Komagataella phaffii GS115]CCA37499.1 Mitochondrial inner membrane protein insertion mediating protein [Komagataella phaffii CBS 7435]